MVLYITIPIAATSSPSSMAVSLSCHTLIVLGAVGFVIIKRRSLHIVNREYELACNHLFILKMLLTTVTKSDSTVDAQAAADFTFATNINALLRDSPSNINAIQNQNYIHVFRFFYFGPTEHFLYSPYSAMLPHPAPILQQGSSPANINVEIISEEAMLIVLSYISFWGLSLLKYFTGSQISLFAASDCFPLPVL